MLDEELFRIWVQNTLPSKDNFIHYWAQKRRINDFIFDEKQRQKKLEDPSLRVLEPETTSFKISRNVGEPFGMNLASVLCVRDTLPNGLAALNYVKVGK